MFQDSEPPELHINGSIIGYNDLELDISLTVEEGGENFHDLLVVREMLTECLSYDGETLLSSLDEMMPFPANMKVSKGQILEISLGERSS